MVSLRELSKIERSEMDHLLSDVACALRPFGGKIFAFEHGSERVGSIMGCGVDHAHLHVVPLDFELVDWVTSKSDKGLDWTSYSEFLLTNLPPTGEYISVWEVSSRRGAVADVTKPVSQWMRRAIACKLGIDSDWDYRTSPQENNIRLTVETIRRST